MDDFKPRDRSLDAAYRELKQVHDKLLAAAQAMTQGAGQPDGPGVLALPGMLAKLRAAAEDSAAVKNDHEASMS